MTFDALLAWLLTYFVHSTLLLSFAWLTSYLLGSRRLAAREVIWRFALIGGLLTATVQYAMSWEPLGGSRSLHAMSVDVAEGEVASVDTRYSSIGLDAGLLAKRKDAPLPAITAAEPTRASRTESRFVPIALASWSVVSFILLGRLSIAFLRLRWRLSGRVPVVEGRLFRVFRRLASVAGVKPSVCLSSSHRIRVPLARGLRRGEVCVPVQVQVDLDQEQQETVLAHELAHVRRRDPVWLLSARLLECVLFFQPLNIVARKKLQQIAELRCDDWAVERTGRPVALAKCLTQVAEWGLEGPHPLAAVSMAGSGSQLGRRVRRLLEREYPMPDAGIPRWLKIAVPAMLLVVTLTAPGVSGSAPAEPEPPRETVPAPTELTPLVRPVPASAVKPAAGAEDVLARPQPVADPETVAAPRVEPVPRPLARPVFPALAPVATVEALPTMGAPRAPRVEEILAPELEELAEHLAHLEVVLASEALELAETAEELAMAKLEAVSRNGEIELIELELEEVEELEALEELEETALMSLRGREADLAEMGALLEAEIEQLAVRYQGELSVIEARMARRLEASRDPERQRRIEERIELHARRIEERAERMADEVEDRERRLQETTLTSEERGRLREEARARAEAARPSLEEMRELREEVRREVERMRPNLEEQQRLREELRQEIEQLRARFQVDLQRRLEELRELREDSVDR